MFCRHLTRRPHIPPLPGGTMQSPHSAARPRGEARFSETRYSAIQLTSIRTTAALLLAMCLSAGAQVRFGGVVGTVTDPSGAAVTEATVTLTNLDTNEKRTTTTGPTGNYTFPNVNAGRYRLEIEKAGFNKLVREPLEVQVDVMSRADAALQVGAVTQTVEVTTQAPLLQTDSSSLGQTVEANQIVATPISGRNTNNLLTLVPGVVAGGTTYGVMVGNQAGGARTNSIAFGNYAIG